MTNRMQQQISVTVFDRNIDVELIYLFHLFYRWQTFEPAKDEAPVYITSASVIIIFIRPVSDISPTATISPLYQMHTST